MKRKCDKCKGKGGRHLMRRGCHPGVWQPCLDCRGHGVTYHKTKKRKDMR
jgi:DnaJ-class molecular chaperone